jgi:hypothetical protein
MGKTRYPLWDISIRIQYGVDSLDVTSIKKYVDRLCSEQYQLFNAVNGEQRRLPTFLISCAWGVNRSEICEITSSIRRLCFIVFLAFMMLGGACVFRRNNRS